MREGEREESSVNENTDWDGEGEKYRLGRCIPDSLFFGLIFPRNGVTKSKTYFIIWTTLLLHNKLFILTYLRSAFYVDGIAEAWESCN